MMTVPIIIDFEASGFGQGYPIEVGFSGRHGEGWCSLIRPKTIGHIGTRRRQKVHGIAREILVERGNTAQFVAEQLNFFLGGRTVYHTDGLGARLCVDGEAFDAAEIVPKFKLTDLFEIIEDEQMPIWQTTKIKSPKNCIVARHRASSDARVLQLTWLRTLTKHAKQTV